MNDPQAEGSHGKLHRTTEILSHAAWRRGGVAARGARAAARRNAADRRADGPRRGRSGNKGPLRGIPARAREAWMVGRPQCPYCLSLCAGRRAGAGARERAGRAATRRDPRKFDAGHRRVAAGEPHDPDRVAVVADPIGSGFVASLPRPGGNITGVMLYEASVTGKWLAMLKEIAPNLVR